MNKCTGEVALYIGEMVDYLAERLPENSKIARRVIAELAKRRGHPVRDRIIAGIVVVSLSGAAGFGVTQWLDDWSESRPRREARLIELQSGEVRLSVVLVEPGKPAKVLASRTVSKARAEDLVRSPTWEAETIRELLTGSLSAVTSLRFGTAF